MAAVAVRVRDGEGVIVPHMAVGAGHHFSGRLKLMRARQRPSRRAVIERRGSPGDRVMAR